MHAPPLPWALDALRSASVGRLGTLRGDRDAGLVSIDLVPFVFAWLAGPGPLGRLVSAVDHKPKSSQRLRRFANIQGTPQVTVLVDHYESDWTRLWWVRVRGVASELNGREQRAEALDALVAKYAQYLTMRPSGAVLSIEISDLSAWHA